MNLSSGQCAAIDLGQACGEQATMTKPVLLCDEHKVQVAALVVPGILTAALAEVCAAKHGGTRAVSPANAHLIASAQSADMPATERHGALVYFLANGGRVKIGFTKSLIRRLSALSLREDSLLLLLHGGQSVERALHCRFGAYRINDSEWFELSAEIVRFIADKGPTLSTQRPRVSRSRKERSRPAERGATMAAMRRHWVAQVAAGTIPTGGDLNRAVGKDPKYSLGKRYANAWREEVPVDVPDPVRDVVAAHRGGGLK